MVEVLGFRGGTFVPRLRALRGACGVSLAGLWAVKVWACSLELWNFGFGVWNLGFAVRRLKIAGSACLPRAPRNASRAPPLPLRLASATILKPVSEV